MLRRAVGIGVRPHSRFRALFPTQGWGPFQGASIRQKGLHLRIRLGVDDRQFVVDFSHRLRLIQGPERGPFSPERY